MKDNSQSSILIHADGTIQVTNTKGRLVRVGYKSFELVGQAHNDQECGPFVYTETTAKEEVMSNVIPLPDGKGALARESSATPHFPREHYVCHLN